MDLIKLLKSKKTDFSKNLKEKISGQVIELDQTFSISLELDGYIFNFSFIKINSTLVYDLHITAEEMISDEVSLKIIHNEEVGAIISELTGEDFHLNDVLVENFQGNLKVKNIGVHTEGEVTILNVLCDRLDVTSAKKATLIKSNCSIGSFFASKFVYIKDLEFNQNSRLEFVAVNKLEMENCSNLTLEVLNVTEFAVFKNCTFDLIEIPRILSSTCKFINCNVEKLVIGDMDFHSKESHAFLGLKPDDMKGTFVVDYKKTKVSNLLLIELDFIRNHWINRRINKRRNHFVKFVLNDNYFNPEIERIVGCKWSYAGVRESDKYPEAARVFINNLKSFYSDKNDVFNTQIMNAYEKKWYLNNSRFNLPLSLSSLSNNFGLSLLLPFCWILIFFLVQVAILLYASGQCGSAVLMENWGVFFNIVNPAHKISLFVDVLEGKCIIPISYSNCLYVVGNVNRIFIGYFIFQFVNAFRYKYKLR